MSTADISYLFMWILISVGGVCLLSLFAGWVFDAYDEWRREE